MFFCIRLTLRSLIGRPGRKSPPAARRLAPTRLSLEALDGRIMPANFIPNPDWSPPPPVMIAPSPLRMIALPSPMSLVGKSVSLTDSTGHNAGTLTIASLTLQPDGSYTLSGTFVAHTRLPSRDWTDTIAVVGYISAPRGGGPLVTTASLHFHGQAINTNWGYVHHVEYNGTLSQGWNDAWTSGNLDACLEYEFDCIGPGQLYVNGTFP